MRRSPRSAHAVAPRPVIRTPVILDGRPAEWRALDRLGWFAGPSWQPWRTALRALLADPLTPADGPEVLQLYTACTDRATWPTQRHRRAFYLVGRRGGKSLSISKLAVVLAAFTDVRPYLAAGEVATIMILASDRRQARIIFRYILALFQSDPALAALLVGEPTQDLIRLANAVQIEIHTSSFRSTRGYTLLAVLGDEVAFWSRQHVSNPDHEVITALEPGLGTIPFSLLLGISTVYSRRGVLFQAFTDHYGKPADPADPVLVWKAATRVMNPTFSAATVAAALAKDPAAGQAEFLAEFRSDVESFATHDVVTAAVDRGWRERPPVAGWPYVAFCDPSGSGSAAADSMTLAIAHPEGERAVLDGVWEWRPPFNPDVVVSGCAELLRAYGVGWLMGDKYAGAWPASRFAAYGLLYEAAPRTKSELYLDLLPALASGRVRLLDQPRLIAQLLSLERRTGRSGKDAVDHPVGAKDDAVNAAAGALLLALETAAQQDLAALEQLSENELAFAAQVARHWGRDPLAGHPDFVGPDHGTADPW